MKVQLVENVLKANDEVASLNRRLLNEAGIFALDIIGAPGCGKTAMIEAATQMLQPELRVGIIVGDLATQRDADRMAKWCEQVIQINTGKGCHLEAHHVRQALERMDLTKIDVLFIENVGNLICPVGFDLGQDVKIGMFSVSGGDDKAAKHPFVVCESAVLLLSKTDLLQYIPFDMQLFRDDVKRLNPNVDIIGISVPTGQGMDKWVHWIKAKRSLRFSRAEAASL
ncbi:MAG: hydrogenase nickel incorporation protein HypB [Tepidisphaerales bacterium]